jgi:hypothetical protein
MTSQASPVTSQPAPNPQLIFDLATGFMRAKHLFVAGELGIFEKLAHGPITLEELAAMLGTPRRTTRIIADAVTALGLLERHGDKYRNSEVAQAYLSGCGSTDMRQLRSPVLLAISKVCLSPIPIIPRSHTVHDP